MSLLTKKQFSEDCGIQTKQLSVYIKRGKVILQNDLIDTTNEFNRQFMEKQLSKKSTDGESSGQQKKKPPLVPPSPPTDDDPENLFSQIGIPTYTQSERYLKYLDTNKRKAEIEKLQFEIAKKKGEVIPSELVKPVFLQHNQSIVTEFKNTIDEILRLFAKKHSLTLNEHAEMTGQMVTCINETIKKATLLTVKSVENIIQEHIEKRGIGEKL